MPSARYRPDIDGLRAIAVLAVVAFHAFPAALRGGFAGVDVFFVISGCLITRSITDDLGADAFTFSKFYARRARRIFPALVVVLLATLALAWAVAGPNDVQRVAEQVLAGAFFSSNLLFWHQAGYFDTESAGKPLLHLWSLGIEEQFYLVWPALFLAIARLRRFRVHAIVVIAAASFALDIHAMSVDVPGAFYSPLARAWELMVGALLGVSDAEAKRSSNVRSLLSAIGLALVVAACILSDPALFPGWYALPPVIGTALVIAGGADAFVNRALLSRKVAVVAGLVSYPLYLWHWPLLVFARRVSGGPLTVLATSVVLLLACALAYATFRLLELPLRTSALVPVAVRSTLALVAVASLGAAMFVWPASRYGEDADAALARAARVDWHTPLNAEATYFASADTGAPQVVFVGDSQVEQYFPVIREEAGRHPGLVVAFSTQRGCRFLPTFKEAACGRTYRRSLALASLPSVRRVVIASAWELLASDTNRTTPASPAFAGLGEAVAVLRASGKDVVLIAAHPASPSADPEQLEPHMRVGVLGTTSTSHFAASFPLSEFDARDSTVNRQLREVAGRTGARYIDPAPPLCPERRCFTTTDQGIPIRVDAMHLRPFAVRRYLTYVPGLLELPPTAP